MYNKLIPIIGIERLRMSTDGTGIRTLIGTYGCTLRCKYCLNPHSWGSGMNPLLYTPEELYDKVKIDNLYFQTSDGGITIGGGEPLLHIEGIEHFASLCPNSWNLWAETSLNVNWQLVLKAEKIFEHFIVDIKTMNPSIYRAYTGADARQAYDNLLLLKEIAGASRITVRVPVIPKYADADLQKESAARLSDLGITDIDLFTYQIA